MLLNSFGTRVSGHREHKKAFRSTIFTFKMCGNHHLKKLGGKTLRWLNFARVHPSVKKRDLQGRAGAAEVTWSALSSALSAGTAGGGRERGGGEGEVRHTGGARWSEPLRSEPLAVRLCITRCQCGLSQQPPSLCGGHARPVLLQVLANTRLFSEP